MALDRIDVLVVGSINMDLVITLDRAPQGGETVFGDQFRTYPGGKGANQAVAAARLGARTAMLGRVGDDGYGRELTAGLNHESIQLQPADPTPAAPTGTAFILVERSGENRIVVVPGANARLEPADLDPTLFGRSKVVLISQEVPAETVARALQLAKAAGCITILNPAPARPVAPEVLANVDVLVPNRSEAALLTGRPVTSLAEARIAADSLLQRGAGTVVVTLGSQGALAVRENLSELVPAYPVTPADTTAAGDAFCGGLAASLSRGEPLLAAVGYGAAAAAIAVTRPGAQPSLPTADEVRERMNAGR